MILFPYTYVEISQTLDTDKSNWVYRFWLNSNKVFKKNLCKQNKSEESFNIIGCTKDEIARGPGWNLLYF